MTRFQWRPVLAVGLAAAILSYVGCGRTFRTIEPGQASKTKPATASEGGAASSAGEEASGTGSKLFADWKGLAATIVITGEMNGYLDPCGCTKGQLGGLGRRFDLLARMDKQNIPSARIDLGSLTKNPANARGGVKQAEEKFNTAIAALEQMKYDAVALSPEDLKFGVFQTLGVLLNQKDKLPIVAANVAPSEAMAQAFAGIIRPSVVAPAGPYKIGVTAIVDPEWYKALKDPELTVLEVKPPAEALPDVLRKLEAESDVQVLMVQGPPEMARSLGEQFKGFDLIVATSPVADPDGRAEPINDGKSYVIQVGQQGKYVGVVGLLAVEKGQKTPPIRYQRLPLTDQRYRNADEMRTLIDVTMQQHLKDLQVVENFPRMANAAAPTGSAYAGAAACKTCHPNAYDKWLSTPHSHAFETLIHPKDPQRIREFDAECVTCHTTGFTYKTGWVSAEKTPQLKGNQCENCHGPASKHVEDPTNKEFLTSLHRTAESADKSGFCQKCHDSENSPDFAFKVYYPRIVHKGLDNLNDPKIRQGKPPAQARAEK